MEVQIRLRKIEGVHRRMMSLLDDMSLRGCGLFVHCALQELHWLEENVHTDGVASMFSVTVV